MTGRVSPEQMSALLIDLAPSGGPLRPLVLHGSAGAWSFTNDNGQTWWELGESDLPIWLLRPRIVQMLSLPCADTPSWFVPPRSPGTADEATRGTPSSDILAESVHVIRRIMDLPQVGKSEPESLVAVLDGLEQDSAAANGSALMQTYLKDARKAAARLTGDLIGVRCDAREALRAAFMRKAEFAADMAMLFGFNDLMLGMQMRLLGRASWFLSFDEHEAVMPLLSKVADRCLMTQREELWIGASDVQAMIGDAKSGKHGLRLGPFRIGKLQRACGQASDLADTEIRATIDTRMLSDSPVAWMHAHPEWLPPTANPGGMWQFGATDGSTPFLGILPRTGGAPDCAVLMVMPPVQEPAASAWTSDDSAAAVGALKQLARRVSAVPLCGYRWACASCTCPLLPGATACPSCHKPAPPLRHPVDGAALESRAALAYFNSDQAAARAAVDATRWFAAYAARFKQRCSSGQSAVDAGGDQAHPPA